MILLGIGMLFFFMNESVNTYTVLRFGLFQIMQSVLLLICAILLWYRAYVVRREQETAEGGAETLGGGRRGKAGGQAGRGGQRQCHHAAGSGHRAGGGILSLHPEAPGGCDWGRGSPAHGGMRGVLHPLRLCGELEVHAAGHQPGCGQHLQPDGAQQDRCSCPDGGYGHLLHRAVQRQPVCGSMWRPWRLSAWQ